MRLKTVALAALLLVAACSRLTSKNYDKIKVGMTYEEVTSILGAPSRCNDVMSVKACVWGNDRRSISVSFVGDKAIVFTSHNLR